MHKVGRIAGFALATALATGTCKAEPGLNGAYYDVGSSLGSLANAVNSISTLTPTATFIATTVCFPGCTTTIIDAGSRISDFLQNNAINLSADPITNLNNHVVVLTGYLNIPTAGTYAFSLGSDDGSELVIGNTPLLDDGDHPFQTVNSNFNLSAGQIPIKIVQFEDGGSTGLVVLENGDPLAGNDISTNAAAVSEPASAALLLAGACALTALRWRRMKVQPAFRRRGTPP